MHPTPEYAIYTYIKGYAKIYPNMTRLFHFQTPIKVRQSGYEEIKPTQPKPKKETETINPLTVLDSIRRTKTRLSDIVLSNQFELFATFTFKSDRQNIEKLKKQMSKWLENQQARTGKFQYLIVPEFHKDGKSIHFHALLKNYKGKLIDSGKKRKDGRVVYNIKSYTLGFSTCTKIDNTGHQPVSNYIKKYITKDMPEFSNKKRYWCSHNLTRPTKIINPVLFPDQDLQFSQPITTKNNMTLRIAAEPVHLIPEYVSYSIIKKAPIPEGFSQSSLNRELYSSLSKR